MLAATLVSSEVWLSEGRILLTLISLLVGSVAAQGIARSACRGSRCSPWEQRMCEGARKRDGEVTMQSHSSFFFCLFIHTCLQYSMTAFLGGSWYMYKTYINSFSFPSLSLPSPSFLGTLPCGRKIYFPSILLSVFNLVIYILDFPSKNHHALFKLVCPICHFPINYSFLSFVSK